MDAGDHEPPESALGGRLEILRETAAASEPFEGALDHPAAGQDDEAVRFVPRSTISSTSLRSFSAPRPVSAPRRSFSH